MKIEFIKETKNDVVFYYTKVDNVFVTDSLSCDKDKAYNTFQNVVNNKGSLNKIEVIESVEISKI